MNPFKRTPKKAPQNSERLLVNPDEMENPQTVSDYMRRGYAYYGRSEFAKAESDFRAVISIDSQYVDAYYGLGMALKGDKKREESIQAFKQAIALIDQGVLEDQIRANMLRRLAVGHINEMTKGDWNLETEIWQRES